jgi:hypothetical protein
MKDHGQSLDDVSSMSARLLDSSLSVQQSSAALTELLSRFATPERLSPEGQSARSELVGNYVRDIVGGLDSQEGALRELGFAPVSSVVGAQQLPAQSPVDADATSSALAIEKANLSASEDAAQLGTAQASAREDELLTTAQRNQALCRELIAGGEQSQRAASEVVQELFESIARIRALVSEL